MDPDKFTQRYFLAHNSNGSRFDPQAGSIPPPRYPAHHQQRQNTNQQHESYSQSLSLDPARSNNVNTRQININQGWHRQENVQNESALGNFAQAPFGQPASRELIANVANTARSLQYGQSVQQRYQIMPVHALANINAAQDSHSLPPANSANPYHLESRAPSKSSWMEPVPHSSISDQRTAGAQHGRQIQRVAHDKWVGINAPEAPHHGSNQEYLAPASQDSSNMSMLRTSTLSSNPMRPIDTRKDPQQLSAVLQSPNTATVDPSHVYDQYAGDLRQANKLNVKVGENPEHAAAQTLMQTMNAPAEESSEQLEAQMREMFRKMRELNSKNPVLLSQLWQQEREQHLLNESARRDQTRQSSNNASMKSHAATAISQAGKPHIHVTAVNRPASSGSTFVSPQAVNSAPQVASGKWHPDKKENLASVSVELLLAMPENRKKTIHREDILRILDQNPSYVDLCREIESLGLFVDKRKFAKSIIAAVPSDRANPQALSKPSLATGKGNDAKRAVAADSKSPVASLTVPETALTVGKPHVVTQDKESAQPMYALPLSTAMRDAGAQLKATEQATVSLSSHEKKVDNDRVSNSSINFKPPVQRYESPYFITANGNEGFRDLEAIQNSKKNHLLGKTDSVTNATLHKHHASVESGPSQHRTKEEMARKRTFKDLVDLTADLSDDEANPPAKQIKLMSARAGSPGLHNTQWDIVEQAVPHQTTIPPASLSNPLTRSSNIVEQLDKRKALRRKSYNPKTIARDVLLASGRHPEIRQLNAHLAALKDIFLHVDNFADLATFNWELVDPGGPPPGAGNRPLQSLNPVSSFDPTDSSDTDNELHSPHTSRRTTSGGSGSLTAVRQIDLSRSKKRGEKPRRLCPGNARRPTSGTDPERQPITSFGKPTIHKHAQKTKKLVPTGQQSSPNSSLPAGYSALRAAQVAAGNKPTTRGRPVGWRKSMQKSATLASGPASFGSKKSGEPSSHQTTQPEPQPFYSVYECQWQTCSANLHNLSTLRKHIHKLHCKVQPNGNFPCLWGGCGDVTTEINATGKSKAKFMHIELEDAESWKTHVETMHLRPVAWKLGDGPTDGLSDHHDSEVSDAYMSDQQGRQVTPKVIVPASPSVVISPGRRAKKTDEERARETQHALQKKKSEIGPGIDRGGARLANEKRRQGFIDDADTLEVIDDGND